MVAAAILAIGIVGAMQSLIAASQQNVNAQRMVRASQMAGEVRTGLQQQRYVGMVGAGNLIDAANCTANASVLALAGGLQAMTVPSVPCIIDLDAFEATQLPVDVIAPGFTLADADPTTTTDGDLFRRVLVVSPSPAVGPTPDGIYAVTVVVSFRAGVTRMYVRQTAALYNPAVNQGESEI